MNLKQITQSSIVSDLSITKPTFVHLIPDFGKSTYELIHSSGLMLSNCRGLITKSRPLKLGGKIFNARKLYLDTKANLNVKSTDPSQKQYAMINVLQTIPMEIPKNSYMIIDHSTTSQATAYISELTNSKRGLFFLFQQLKKEFNFIKSKFPNFENVILFAISSQPTEAISLYDVVKHIIMMSPDDINANLNVFDRFMLVSICNQNLTTQPIIFPIMGINNKGHVISYSSNISKISGMFKNIEMTISDQVKTFKEIKTSPISLTTPLSKDIVVDSKIDNSIHIKSEVIHNIPEINKKQLSKILKKYKIKDKTVGDNIKASLDAYLISIGSDVNVEDAEHVVLKAIHQTIFGTSEIGEEYQHNPAKLISKLVEVNTYSQDIKIPNMTMNHILEPNDVIAFDRVTGLVRQKYEFSDNIHGNIKKLFKSLETRTDFPINIVNFKYDYQDNNLNRVINYEITLKNQSGGFKEPYTVNIKVPAIVNDRYFKLNGKSYILANQQYFVPITKTNPTECRLLTPYAIMTLDVVNMRFNISELDKIIIYLESKYSQLIKNIEKESDKTISIEFISNAVMNLYNSPYYKDDVEELIRDDNKLILKKDNSNVELQIGRSEYLFDKLVQQMKTANPKETLNKSEKSIPYIRVYMSGIKLPLIIYMWQQLGLINAFAKLGIDFNFEKQFENNAFTFPLKDDKTLYINIRNKREELIVNGLLLIDKGKFKFGEEELNDKTSIEQFIQSKEGTRAVYHLNNNTLNMIDPITTDILEFQDKPTSLINLICEEMIDKLLNDKTDENTDLRIYRSRQAEVMFHLMYKNLMMAHNEYKRNLTFGNENVKLFLTDTYIIDCLLGIHPHSKGGSVLDYTQPYNPVSELKSAAKLIKTGPGGIPGKRSFKKDHRNIHPSYYGNIGANSTSEYADVGIVNHMTLTPLISNQYGNYGIKDISKCSGWDLVSLDEGLVPFINELDATRAILAYTHRAQASPIIDGDEPIVATGAEFFIPQLSSNRFIQRAKKDGNIVDIIKDNYIKVKYNDNATDYIDIAPRLATTKRASYINLSMNTLEKNDNFKENQPIAWSHNFNGECYASGKNLKMAVMNYLGFSHEDGYVISQDTADNIRTEIVEEIKVIIPDNAKVLNLIDKIGYMTSPKESLLEFSYSGSVDEYLDKYNIIDSESEELEAAMYNSVNDRLKIESTGGEIVQIRVHLNNRDRVDPMVSELWNKVTSDLKKREKLYAYSSKTKESKLSATDNLDMSQLRIGHHKHRGIEFEGVKISYFIKRVKILNIGDKMANRYGGKGVITKIIDKDSIPKGEYTGDINVFISPISILGRKNMAVIKELYIGKIFYNLPRILKEKINNRYTAIKEIRNMIISVYDHLDPSPDKKFVKSIKTKLDSINDISLKTMINNDKLKLNYIIEPFTNVSMDSIKTASEIINIQLDERVYIPELGTWTKNKVPVGIQYMNSLEQLATDYESLRSTGGYVGITGQPKKGKADMGGQSIGNLDVYNLLSYDCPAILEEFMTIRSDDFRSKRSVVTDIIQNGSANIPLNTGDANTRNLYNIHMIAMGLNVTKL